MKGLQALKGSPAPGTDEGGRKCLTERLGEGKRKWQARWNRDLEHWKKFTVHGVFWRRRHGGRNASTARRSSRRGRCRMHAHRWRNGGRRRRRSRRRNEPTVRKALPVATTDH